MEPKPPKNLVNANNKFGQAMKLLSGLPQEVLDHPDIVESLDTIKGIALGRIQGRNLQSRLNAAIMLIEFYAGKPKARMEHELGPTLAEMLSTVERKEIPD